MHYHEAITPEDRDTLWNKGVLATDSPTELQNAIFYYTTCAFVVERSIETSSAHSLLKSKAATAMFKRGGFSQLHLTGKSAVLYNDADAGMW